MARVRMISDFSDFYDDAFLKADAEEYVLTFDRLGGSLSPSSIEFSTQVLSWMLPTIPAAAAKDIEEPVSGKVVAYPDPCRSSEWQVLGWSEAKERHPDFFCCHYIEDSTPSRLICVGDQYFFWIKDPGIPVYPLSQGDLPERLASPWDSASSYQADIAAKLKGVMCECLEGKARSHRPLARFLRGRPLISIDFVGPKESPLAISLRTNPVLRGTGIEHCMGVDDVYRAIASRLLINWSWEWSPLDRTAINRMLLAVL